MGIALRDQPMMDGTFIAESPSELAARIKSPNADIVIVPQQLSLDRADSIRRLANYENRILLEPEKASLMVSQSLSEMGMDSPELVAAMVCGIYLFAETFKKEKVELRLELTDQQSCPKFHCDNVYVRMLATYFGPTTEFMDKKKPTVVHRAPLNALVFLKGHQHPGYEDRILHRSPEFAEGDKRLCMIVNFPDWLDAKC
jgi:hypothetical protein